MKDGNALAFLQKRKYGFFAVNGNVDRRFIPVFHPGEKEFLRLEG